MKVKFRMIGNRVLHFSESTIKIINNLPADLSKERS